MSISCFVKAPYDSRTFTSHNIFKRQPEGQRRTDLQAETKEAWEQHRGRWGTAIYELPTRGTVHKDRQVLRDSLLEARLPPCSLKGHRHFGALAEPITLLEGDIDIAQQGASQAFYKNLQCTVMGFSDTEPNNAAKFQRSINRQWNDHGTFSQPHTQACLEYATSLKDTRHGKSTHQVDYVVHKKQSVYQPLQHISSHMQEDNSKYSHIKTPFAEKAFKQQKKYTELISLYYRELYKDDKSKEIVSLTKPRRSRNTPKIGQNRCSSTSPMPSIPEKHLPKRRSSSAMLKAVSEATSTSEVSCSLAAITSTIVPCKKKEIKLATTKKITDVNPNREMDLRRSDQKFSFEVPPVEYFLSNSVSTQTNSGLVVGLNPLWPPSNKIDNPERIGYPHLSLPLGIKTTVHEDFQINHTHRETTNTTTTEPSPKNSNNPFRLACQPKAVSFKEGGEKKDSQDSKKMDWALLPDASLHSTGDFTQTEAHRRFNSKHEQDWVPRIWDYNYLLFHLNRRHHLADTKDLLSCHASHIDGGLIG